MSRCYAETKPHNARKVPWPGRVAAVGDVLDFVWRLSLRVDGWCLGVRLQTLQIMGSFLCVLTLAELYTLRRIPLNNHRQGSDIAYARKLDNADSYVARIDSCRHLVTSLRENQSEVGKGKGST